MVGVGGLKKKDVPVSGVRRNLAALADVLEFPRSILNISACRITIGKGEGIRNQSVAKSLVAGHFTFRKVRACLPYVSPAEIFPPWLI